MLPIVNGLVTVAVVTVIQHVIIKFLTKNTQLVGFDFSRKATPDKVMAYVVCNLFKSAVLFWAWTRLEDGCLPLVIAVAQGGDISPQILHPMAIAYLITDASALVLNKMMDQNTINHHIFTTALACFYLLCTSFSVITHPLIWYAAFSAFAYAVNGVMALRRLHKEDKWSPQKWHITHTVTFWMYLIALLLNWLGQPLLLFRAFAAVLTWQSVLWQVGAIVFLIVIMVSFLVFAYDDIKIVIGLGKHSFGKAPIIGQVMDHKLKSFTETTSWMQGCINRADEVLTFGLSKMKLDSPCKRIP